MIENITTLLSGILSAISTLIDPTVAGETVATAAPYVALLALPVLGGIVAFTVRLVKKAR